jgi:hypothetical protein
MIECRQHPRVPVDLQVFFSTTGNTEIREGTMFDLSLGGCAVATTSSVRPGTSMRLLIRATELGSAITIESAAIRWTHHGEFGLEFMGISDLDHNRLSRLLQVSSSYPTRPN